VIDGDGLEGDDQRPHAPGDGPGGLASKYRNSAGGVQRPARVPAGGTLAMKVFSFVLWLAWMAIGVRVLLVPYLTVRDGMLLLLVAAPAMGLLGGIRWLLKDTTASSGV
jgi:hypothetical protein